MIIPFEKSFASHEKHIFWSKKNKKQPREVYKSSSFKFWFDCCKCGHEFESILGSITNGGCWCPYCANQKLCDNEDCKTCLEKSFASHEKHIFWSKKNKKQPREVFKSAHSNYLFDCEKCKHEFSNSLTRITDNKWCGFCANKKLCYNEDCKICLEKSFASHEKHIFWSKKNKKQPREVFKSAHSNYLFDCGKCEHEFESILYSITNMGCWCSYCANKKLCEKEDCNTCFDKSFDSHHRSIFWSSKNNIQPREVLKSSSSKYLFVCENTHEFESSCHNISTGNTWCPKCVNKTETKLYEIMVKLFQSIITQFKQDWCKNINNNYYLPFDFCIPEDKIIIELDGRQHFIQVPNWIPPEITFENDKYKEKCANDNGYSTIRIIQEDVWNDKYDWCKELCEEIENIKKENKVVNRYLCKKNEYDKYK